MSLDSGIAIGIDPTCIGIKIILPSLIIGINAPLPNPQFNYAAFTSYLIYNCLFLGRYVFVGLGRVLGAYYTLWKLDWAEILLDEDLGFNYYFLGIYIFEYLSIG